MVDADISHELVGLVHIDELILDFENPRIPSQASEIACMKAIVKNRQKENEILNLARDIAQKGLYPDPIIVSKSIDGNKWIVRDGNRRITAIKLLHNPELASNWLKDKLLDVITEYQSFPTRVNCHRCKDEDETLRFLHLKHGGSNSGVGQITWGSIAKTRYSEKARESNANIKALNLIRWVQKYTDIEIDEDEFPISTLAGRIMSKDKLLLVGFELDGNDLTLVKDEKTTLNKVLQIIYDLENGMQTSRSLETAAMQKKYVEDLCHRYGSGDFLNDSGVYNPNNSNDNLFTSSSKTATSTTEQKTVDSQTNTNNSQVLDLQGSLESKKAVPPNPQTRRKLFTKTSFVVPKEEVKTRKILAEIRELETHINPIATAMLLRAFIEASTEYYMKKNTLSAKTEFASKIRKCAEYMLEKGRLSKDQKLIIDKHTLNDGDMLHINTLHGYVHSQHFHPHYQTLNAFWDEIEFYISECWR